MQMWLDPILIALSALLWPLARAVVFVGAAAVTMWSRKATRRREARRLLELLDGRAQEGSAAPRDNAA